MKEISLEQIVTEVVNRVIARLKQEKVKIISRGEPNRTPGGEITEQEAGRAVFRCERPDMSGYRTPILTERQLLHLHELTGEIVVPAGTVITPKAKQLVREKGIQVIFE